MRAFENAEELRSFLPEKDLFTNMKAVLGEGTMSPDVLLVKKAPHAWDAQSLKPLMGRDGLAIRRALLQEGISFYATCAVPFFDPKDKLKKDDAANCASVINEEMRRVGATKVLLLGADAARWTPAFEYPFRRFNELLNRNIECNGITFRVAHAPMAIVNSPAVYAEFTRSIGELVSPETAIRAQAPDSETYRVITNQLQARRVLAQLGDVAACDVETSGLNPYEDKLLTIQLSWNEGEGYAFPWDLLSPDEWAEHLSGTKLIFQNGQFDVKALAANGVFVQVHEDTMLMHSLVDETPGTHSMEHMAQRYLGVDKWAEMVDYSDLENTSIEVLGRYGARDTDLTLRLANEFRPKVEGRHINTVLHRAANSLIRSEVRGVKINRELAEQFRLEIEKALHDRREYICDTYGIENPASHKQVATLLYETLGLPKQYMKRKLTTAGPAIEKFVAECPAVGDILEYRHLVKAGGTYVKNILELSERDGRYHPEFRLAATETGRVAERLITLIPRPDALSDPDLGKQYQIRLRELFVPDEGYVMIGADYSGLEIAMAAYLTNDPVLVADLKAGLDIHSAVAISAFDLDEPLEPYATLKKRVSDRYGYQRTLAKGGTFTWLYGGSASAIMGATGCSDEQAESILAALVGRYKGVASWQEYVRASVQHTGTVMTPWGRTRRFHFPKGMDRQLVEEQLREATNAPIQGMATDMNLAAFAELESRGYEMLFPFHDAIYLQHPEDQADAAMKVVTTVMESRVKGPVQFQADVKCGPHWGAL